MMFLLREREINKSIENIRDPARIRTQDLLNTSQMLLPLSHLDPWQSSGRQATQAALPSGLSRIRILCLCMKIYIEKKRTTSHKKTEAGLGNKTTAVESSASLHENMLKERLPVSPPV